MNLTPLLLIPALLADPAGPGGPTAATESGAVERFVASLGPLGFDGVFLLAEHGEPVILKGYGLANRETSTPWSAETVSTVGSITKQFTAAGILKLREQGAIRLLDTLDQHFDDVPADKRHITIHHLLTHTSGIQDPPGIIDHTRNTRSAFAALVLGRPLAFEPGSEFRYSNAGYSLLAAIIEQTTGSSYEQWMRENVFLPAGMKQTGYLLGDWTDSDLAQGYIGTERWGTILERPMADDGPFWMLRGNGGIHSTAGDMLRWAQALLDGDVLSRASVDLLWAPHVPEPNGFYGYGWTVEYAPDGTKIVWHDGGNGRLAANFRIIPGPEQVIFTMTNTVATSRLAHRIPPAVSRLLVQGEPLPDIPLAVPFEPSTRATFAGQYELPGGGVLSVEPRDSGLVLQPRGADAYAAALSTASYDPATLEQMTRRIDELIGAELDGNFQPMANEYGDVDAAHLQRRFEEMRATNEPMHGRLRSHRVFGTWADSERMYTQGAFVFEQRAVPFTYLWSGEGVLLGRFVTPLPLDDELELRAAADGRFFHFSMRLMQARTFDFQRDAEGVMTVTTPTGTVAARRERD